MAWCASSVFAAASERAQPETSLHGEVRQGVLELVNVGRCAARDVAARSSGPWLALGAEGSQEIDVDKTATGASGLAWTVADSDGQALTLAAGATALLPCLLRARGCGGAEPLRLLAQYSPLLDRGDALSWKKLAVSPKQPRAWPASSPARTNDRGF